ncbi:Tectonic-2 Precursor [Collichthys lucidus]|uniref:Tectonic-2 n=1 Tax=Collichthys lucidus TaxID=240159 RepID=A0A4U5UVF7_COLLU|nr:Tectonic-2 Precursor [Collichthys lucidus]
MSEGDQMANVVDVLMSSSISRQVACVLLFISLAHTQNIVVFQPSYLTASGPTVTALLLGNTSDISLNLRAVSPSNKTGESRQDLPDALPLDPYNKTVIPNQVYQTLGSCPCDLTFRSCDVRCCCDKDCSPEELKLFVSDCLPGPFGGHVSPAPEYQCSVQSSENSPDWFPFLCVNSPTENNPYLGLFYQGKTMLVQCLLLRFMFCVACVVKSVTYNVLYMSATQKVLGRCVNSAPVAFLKNFQVECVTLLRSCPTGPPLQTLPTDLRLKVKNGLGGDVTVDVIDEEAIDLGLFIPSSDAVASSDESLVCDNVTVALDYRVYWRGNGITNITLTRTVGTITLNNSVVTLNSSTAMEDTAGSCYGVPSHQHIHVRSLITGLVDGVPQRDILALQVSYSLSPWALDCGGGDVSPCVDPMETQMFPITSSVTFTDIPINTGSPKTRFQINFTEYDCSRNDVCWPELAFPITKYYTGEPYSQSLAKGLILVFFFIAASILGTPWRQIRQAWSCVCL